MVSEAADQYAPIKRLLDILTATGKHYDLDKIKDAYVVLCELFSHLCEHKRYIDLYIYDNLLEFKKQFDDNLEQKTAFFFINDMKLLNKNLVEKNMNELIKTVTLKTIEIKD